MSAFFRTADLLKRHAFLAMLRWSKASDFGLVYDTERRCHFACFKATVWGRDWMLHIPVVEYELTIDQAAGIITWGNRMIEDIEAHYRQQQVAR